MIGKCADSPLGTSGIAKTPLAGLSSAELAVIAELETAEVAPEDAFVAL